MLRLGVRGTRWLKGVHLIFCGTWIGAAVCMLLIMNVKSAAPVDGQRLFAYNSAVKLIDDVIVVPCALGSLFTGLAYSLFTPWGFFRHAWVTVKWAVTVGAILFGTFFLGPWVNRCATLAENLGLEALQDTAYQSARSLNSGFGLLQVSLLVATVFVSILKPWKKKGKGQAAE